MSGRLLLSSEVADRLQVTGRYVSTLCRTGRLRAVLIGREWRVEESALDEFIAANTREPVVARPRRRRAS